MKVDWYVQTQAEQAAEAKRLQANSDRRDSILRTEKKKEKHSCR